FQAEDGIRDKLVTGVQTCALPISLFAFYVPRMRTALLMVAAATFLWFAISTFALSSQTIGRRTPEAIVVAGGTEARFAPVTDSRSEERRVGKECRVRRVA